jgi:ABC-2 type transport system permease protein
MTATLTAGAGAIGDVAAMTGRELRRSVRSIDALLTALVLPVMILTMFVFIFGGALATGGRYIDYVVPGTILLCAGFGAAATATSVAQDMATGTIDRFRTMPIFRSSVLVGHVTASAVRNLAASTLVVGFALLYGFRASGTVLDWVLAAGLVALFIVAMTWIACAFGLVLSVDAAASLTFVMLFLPYVSSGFVPTETLPSVLRGFAEHQPLTPIIETVRALLTGTPVGSNGALALAWCLVLLAAGMAASVLGFRGRRR